MKKVGLTLIRVNISVIMSLVVRLPKWCSHFTTLAILRSGSGFWVLTRHFLPMKDGKKQATVLSKRQKNVLAEELSGIRKQQKILKRHLRRGSIQRKDNRHLLTLSIFVQPTCRAHSASCF